MIYGYARVSTQTQKKDGNSLEGQVQRLKEHGAEKIYQDAFTGTKTHRPQLDILLNEIQSGDTLLVTKLDRIARSSSEGAALISALLDKGIIVHVLNMGIIDNTPTGKLTWQIFLAFAEFERDMIVERTTEGKAIARQNPSFKEGRPRKYSDAQINHAMELLKTHSKKQVSEMTGISTATLARNKSKFKSQLS